MNEMNITSAQFNPNETNDGNGSVIAATIDGVEMQVPVDTDNRHYAAIKAKHDDPNDSFTIADAD